MKHSFSGWIVIVALAGCQSGPGNAPVSDRRIVATEPSRPARDSLPTDLNRSPNASPESARKRGDADWRPGSYTVKRGDTLYAIALDHGLDYRELAAWNGLADPNRILAGQTLRLTAPPAVAHAVAAPQAESVAPVVIPEPSPVTVEAKPLEERTAPGGDVLPAEAVIKTEPKAEKIPYGDDAYARVFGREPPVVAAQPAPSNEAASADSAGRTQSPAAKDVAFESGKWTWPSRGDVLSAFDGTRNKGIAIAGKQGEPVLAANAGKVVYVGNAIQAYGHLAIVKHGAEYLTVYAHNAVVLVKEGQWVSAGQKIAEMGSRPGGAPSLHFEVRKLGRPIDPLKVLPQR